MITPKQPPKSNPRIGSSLDEFLAEKGLLDETRGVAIAEVEEWLRSSADHGIASGKERPEKSKKDRKAPADV